MPITCPIVILGTDNFRGEGNLQLGDGYSDDPLCQEYYDSGEGPGGFINHQTGGADGLGDGVGDCIGDGDFYGRHDPELARWEGVLCTLNPDTPASLA